MCESSYDCKYVLSPDSSTPLKKMVEFPFGLVLELSLNSYVYNV